MAFVSHRDYFRRYQLSVAQYGEILVADLFGGEKKGDAEPCFDVVAEATRFQEVLRAREVSPRSSLWPHHSEVVRIQVRSKLSKTPSGVASVIHCKESDIKEMTHLAVIIVHPARRAGSDSAEAGAIVNAWLLSHDAARELRRKDRKVQYIRVTQLTRDPLPNGVLDIKSFVAAVAEAPLDFLTAGASRTLARASRERPSSGSTDADASAAALPVQKTPGLSGGDACVGDTRIPVWTLWQFKELGLTEAQLLEAYPSLTPQALVTAWDYARLNPHEIAEAITRQGRIRARKQQASA